ncbi:MAG: FtsB family cell division protein [Ignavibacteria bacterium]
MKWNFKKSSLILAIIVGALFLLVLTFSDQGFYRHYVYKKNLDELQSRVDSLKKVNDSLSIEINLLKSNLEKIEKVAREKYGMIKPGEKIYKIKIEE